MTQAYSYTNSTGEGATATDTCGDGFNGGRAQAPNSARASLVEGGIFVQYLAQYLMEAGVWAIQGGNNIAGRRPSRASKVVKASADSEVATASAGSKVAYDYESHGTLYSGELSGVCDASCNTSRALYVTHGSLSRLRRRCLLTYCCLYCLLVLLPVLPLALLLLLLL